MLRSLPNSFDGPAANTRGANFRRKATFSRLPDEILENIFLESILKKWDLCDLAMVCRRFSMMIKPSLYSEVTIDLLDEEYIRFHRTLMEHPELGSYIWKTHMTYFSDVGRRYDEAKCFSQARQLLALLPALRNLELAELKSNDGHASLFDIPMTHLRRISFFISQRSGTIQDVLKAVLFPRI
jgi:hypothetical protein